MNWNGSSNDRGRSAESENASTPAGALVIGGDYQGLGIVRSLGREGIPVGILDDETSIARFSRYTVFTERSPSLKDAEATVRALVQLNERRGLEGWVLYPTRDETVAALSVYRDRLCKLYRVPTPRWQTVQWLWDKRKTYELASQLGIPAPRTWRVKDVKDLDQIEGHFPVALKPAIKEHFIYVTRAKAWRANNLNRLRSLVAAALRFMPADEILIQDLIPGNGSCQYSYCALFKEGKPVASLVTRRLRQHPLEFGRASTYVESVELPELERLSERFLRAISYYGLVEMEYKFDPRNGEYKLLDANARTWGYNSIGKAAGVDFPFLLYSDQMSAPIAAVRGKPGIRWVRLLTDLPTGLLSMLKSDVSGRDYLRSLLDIDEEAVFSRQDPLPGFAECALIPYLFFKRGF